MANSFGIPGITVQELAAKISGGDDFLLLDIREDYECAWANMENVVPNIGYLPLSQFDPSAVPDFFIEALQTPEMEIVIMCHHGIRSAQFTFWLQNQGYTHILNLDGGIDAYAAEIDSQVGRY